MGATPTPTATIVRVRIVGGSAPDTRLYASPRTCHPPAANEYSFWLRRGAVAVVYSLRGKEKEMVVVSTLHTALFSPLLVTFHKDGKGPNLYILVNRCVRTNGVISTTMST